MIFKFDETKAGKDAPENLVMSTIKITGDYQESDNPHRNVPQAILEQMSELHKQAEKGTVQIIQKLERLIGKYPKIPVLYNYLGIAYLRHGNRVKYNKINQETAKLFPNYPVTRLNQANQLILLGEFEEAEAILGHDMEVSAFLPNRQIYHTTEVVQFYEATVRFYAYKHQFDVAESRLDVIRGVSKQFGDFYKHNIQKLEIELADKREEVRYESFELYEVEALRKEWVQETDTPPVFSHPEVQWLYQYGLDIPKEKIEAILALPRPSLIADLHKVIDDSMARFDYFESQEWDENSFNFLAHALIILAELKATESFSHALNCLRQDNDWAEFWFGDMITETLPLLYYQMMGDDWTVLKDYLLEPHNETFQRMVITSAIAIDIYHNPEKRQAGIAFLEDILNDFYENRTIYKEIIDLSLTESIVNDLITLDSKTSYPLIEKIYNADMISDFESGDLAEIKTTLFEKNEESFFYKTVPNIFEQYQGMMSWHSNIVRNKSDEDEDVDDEDDETDEIDAESNQNRFNDTGKIDSYRKQQASMLPTQKINETKIGRNDPCSCGSGKKYKKCCGA